MAKKVSFNSIWAEIGQKDEVTELELGNEVVLRVKRTIGAKDAFGFVNTVISMCMNAETGEYMPEAREFAVRVTTMMYYAGVPAPKSADKAYAVTMQTGLYRQIMKIVDEDQHFWLLEAVDEKIRIVTATQTSALSSRVGQLVEAMDDVMSRGSEMVESLEDGAMVGEIRSLIDKLQTGER